MRTTEMPQHQVQPLKPLSHKRLTGKALASFSRRLGLPLGPLLLPGSGLMALSRMPLAASQSAPAGSPHLKRTSERLIDSLRVLRLPCYLCQP